MDVDGVKKERMFAFGASYNLSKRTSLYGDAASNRFPDVGVSAIGRRGDTIQVAAGINRSIG